MRLHGKEQRDEAGFAVQVICQTIRSQGAHEHSKEWREALVALRKAQKILIDTGFYSDKFDPSLAAY